MATHSSILAWRIPWAEEPGGQSPWGHKQLDMTEATEHSMQHGMTETLKDANHNLFCDTLYNLSGEAHIFDLILKDY